MITYTLWVYTPLDRPDEQADFTEITEAVGRVSPGHGLDFEQGEQFLRFQFGQEAGAVGRAVTSLLKIPYVKRVSITRVAP